MKFHYSGKTASGALAGVQGDGTFAEFVNDLTNFLGSQEACDAVMAEWQQALIPASAGSLGHYQQTAQNAPPQQSYQQPATPQWSQQPMNDTRGQAGAPPASPVCKHGPMTFRQGTYKSGARAGQPYTAYFCPSPQGTPDQCKPQFQ